MVDVFEAEQQGMLRKADGEEKKVTESNDIKKLTAGTLRRQTAILTEREEQFKNAEKEYGMKKLEYEDVKNEVESENAKIVKYQVQIKELKAKQKSITGIDYVQILYDILSILTIHIKIITTT